MVSFSVIILPSHKSANHIKTKSSLSWTIHNAQNDVNWCRSSSTEILGEKGNKDLV